MRKIIFSVFAIGIAIGLISWGRTGHNVIGRIAANHLTPEAKSAVSELLGNESLADVASWADDTRDRSTASWHFINVELGLSYDDFRQQVSSKVDVYTALLKEEQILADGNASGPDRINALKFVVHFVGDIHQPMHVSRAEDKGGNSIQVRYDDQGTNLHSLWDTKLLEHAGLSEEQLASKIDKATLSQMKKWQSDDAMRWAWESYQISLRLYGEIEKGGVNIDDAYYQAHIPIVYNRIEMAGIRLAGVLNGIFAKTTVTPSVTKTTAASAPISISVSDAALHYDELVTVTAKVFGTKDFGSMVLVNLGAAYPNSPLTVVLRKDAKSLGASLQDKTIKVTGTVEKYRDKPEIVVTDRSQIKVN